MKKKFTKQFLAMSKYALIGLCMQLSLSGLLVAMDGNAQNVKLQDIYLSVNLDNVSLEKSLETLESLTGFHFAYHKRVLPGNVKLSKEFKNSSLESVLKFVSMESNLQFKRINNTIYVSRKQVSEAAVEEQFVSFEEQKVAITGKVTANDSPDGLPGVNVMVKGTSYGTVTDINGNYIIEIEDVNSILIFSSVGYLSEEVQVSNRSEINIELSSDVTALDEIVVVGYGTQRKRDLTGSVARVDPKEMANLPNVNLVQNLRGTVAGVNVIDNGRPGADGTILIRGQTSISASNAPLIILDGIIYTGGLSDINSNDIESIDILKDASSAAIYGARATNGVILITTKKGTSSKPRFNYNGYYGFSDYARVPEMMNAEQYIQMRRDGAEILNRPFNLNPIEEENFNNGNIIDPWEEIAQSAPMTNHELSMSGKTDRVNYYLSGSYTDMKSKIAGDNFTRFSMRANVDVDINDWLNVGINSGFTSKDYSGIRANFGNASYLSPFSSFYHDDGVLRYLPMDDGLAPNPLFNTNRADNKSISSTIFSNAYAVVQLPVKGLSYRLNTGNNLRFNEDFNYFPAYNRDGIIVIGNGNKQHRKHHYFILENILKYNVDFGDIHNLDFTGLYSFENTSDQGSYLSSNNIFNDVLSYHGLSLGENPFINTTASESSALSAMFRVGYKLMDKYMFNFTVRRDGFSVFGEGRKFGNFPSLGFGWLVSQESFMSGISSVEYLKLRYSYGKNGNRGIAPYTSLSNMNHTNHQYVFGDGGATSVGISPTSMANPFLGWETTVASNLGVDFSLFRDKLSGAVEFYNMNTSDLLLNMRIPNMTGYEDFFTNIGATNNRGIELTLNSSIISAGDFNWSTNLVYTLNRNKITKLTGVVDETGKEIDDIASRRFIGYPLGSNFDYVVDGIWQVEDDFSVDPGAQPGYLRFVDISGDGRIGPEDRKVLHSNQPDFLASITNMFAYKNFTLSILFNGRFGGYSPNGLLNHGTNFYDRTNLLNLPYWMPDNPLTDRPSLNYPNPRGYGFYENRTFVRLQDISLSYNLPSNLLSRLSLNSMQLYISGKNLATFTNWHGWDPEHGSGGRNPVNGPLLKSYVLGVNVSF